MGAEISKFLFEDDYPPQNKPDTPDVPIEEDVPDDSNPEPEEPEEEPPEALAAPAIPHHFLAAMAGQSQTPDVDPPPYPGTTTESTEIQNSQKSGSNQLTTDPAGNGNSERHLPSKSEVDLSTAPSTQQNPDKTKSGSTGAPRNTSAVTFDLLTEQEEYRSDVAVAYPYSQLGMGIDLPNNNNNKEEDLKELYHMTWNKGDYHDEELTAERIADLKEAFSMFDKDGDGAISASELTTVMRSLGMNPTENEIVEIMAELDIDGSGTIELHEFVNVMLDKMQMMDTEDEIKKVFRVFDRDGNGFINAAELRYMMHHVMGQAMTEDDVDDLLKEADIDGDGQLNYEEFVKMLVQE